MQSPAVEKLIKLFSGFPAVGPRTAARFVFYLLKQPKEEVGQLVSLIEQLNQVKLCQLCFYPFEAEEDLCHICRNPNRDKSLLCIVAGEADLEALEKSKKYPGLYFILGNTISALTKNNIKKLRISQLLKRIKDEQIKEIILGLNPNSEGETTALYLERLLKPLNIKITRLGRGLPTGGELEYADEETIASSLESRR